MFWTVSPALSKMIDADLLHIEWTGPVAKDIQYFCVLPVLENGSG